MLPGEFLRAAKEVGMDYEEAKRYVNDPIIWRTINDLYGSNRFDSIVGNGLDRHHKMASYVAKAAVDPSSLLCKLWRRRRRENSRKRIELLARISHLQIILAAID